MQRIPSSLLWISHSVNVFSHVTFTSISTHTKTLKLSLKNLACSYNYIPNIQKPLSQPNVHFKICYFMLHRQRALLELAVLSVLFNLSVQTAFICAYVHYSSATAGCIIRCHSNSPILFQFCQMLTSYLFVILQPSCPFLEIVKISYYLSRISKH